MPIRDVPTTIARHCLLSGLRPNSLRRYPAEGRSSGVMVCGLRDGGEEAADVPGNLYRDVPQERVDRILDLASRYPSAGHTEPQEFIVMPDQRTKEEPAPQARRPRADVHDHRPLETLRNPRHVYRGVDRLVVYRCLFFSRISAFADSCHPVSSREAARSSSCSSPQAQINARPMTAVCCG